MVDAKQQVRSGVFWLGSASLITQVIDALGLIVVLLFLSKDDMGLATLSWSVAVIVESLNGLGAGTSLLRAPSLDREQIEGVFWYAVATALFFFVAVSLAAPTIARFYAAPELTAMIIVSAFKLPIVATALVPQQLINRELRFRDIALMQTSATLLSLLLKIGLAIAGFRAWALVISNVSYGVVVLVMSFWMYPMLPRLRFRYSAIRSHVVYGLQLSAHNILYHTLRNADFLIVGKVLGNAALGVYRVAFDVAMTPPLAVQATVSRTAFPVFSKMLDDRKALAHTFAWMQRGLSLVAVPIALFLSFAAKDLLMLVGSGRWVSAAPALIVLSWAAVPRSLSNLYPELYKAAGKPFLAVRSTLLSCVLLIGGFLLGLQLCGARYGVMPVAFTWLLAYPIINLAQLWYARSVAPLGLQEYFEPYRHPLAAAAIAALPALGVYWLRGWFPERFVISLGFTVLYAVVILAVHAAYAKVFLGMSVRQLFGRKAPATQPVDG